MNDDAFTIAALDTVTPGRLLRFLVEFRAPGGYYSRDTVEVCAGTPTVLAAESAAGTLDAWSAAGRWGIVSGDPGQVSRYITDSPAGNYGRNLDAPLLLRQSLDLSRGVHAYAWLDSRWSLETDYDATMIEASLDSLVWTPLAAPASVPGLYAPQPAGQPVLEGNRWRWKRDRIDLSAPAGSAATRVLVLH